MTRDEAFSKITEELTQAEAALREGREGRARANARRAVGHALAWWLETHPRGREAWPRAAFDRLRVMRDDPDFPPTVREAARLLTLTVPAGVDSPERFLDPQERESVRRRVEAVNQKEHVSSEMDPVRLARTIIEWLESARGNG